MSANAYNDRTTTISKLQNFSTYWSSQIQEWKSQSHTNVEKQHAQQLWSDFLRCFGIIPERIALFEQRADRASTGRGGYIDFFMSGMVIGEAKSLGKNLEKAQEQVEDYLSSIPQHEYPKYSIVTNFESFSLKRLDNSEPTIEFSIDQIADHYDQFRFIIGEENISYQEQQEASIQAAKLMANLYTSILGDEADAPVAEEAPENAEEEDEKTQQTSILMTRLLFLLYGDDAGLWSEDLFQRWVEQETTPASLGAQLNQLFDVLNTPEHKRSPRISDLLAQFPYVNGGIFSDTLRAEFFTVETRDALLEACRFRWTRISVAVFGAMFQLVKSKEARRAAGEHYTSEKNILKTLNPLFLEAFRNEADRLIKNKSTRPADFDKFLEDLASHVFCDPACGGGNFLNLAYAKLREIETDVILERRRRGGEFTGSLDISLDQKLSISQFYGFEISWWASKIAETAMFLVDHQANRRLAQAIGEAPKRLPIKIAAHIVHGNALTLDWAEAIPEPKGQTFIFGNPPFIGARLMSKEQKEELKNAWKNVKGVSNLDYVTGWHIKALDLLADRDGSFAFVTTNSIVQGQSVPLLFGTIFKRGWRIGFAHRTFAWDSEAPGMAAVHCVIVGFTRDNAKKPLLWDYPTPNAPAQEIGVSRINPYLVDSANVLIDSRKTPLSQELPPATFGSMANDGGNLIVETDQYDQVSQDPIAMKYLRPFRGSKELLHSLDRWCLWLEGVTSSDLSKSSVLKERVAGVKTYRENSSRPATQKLAEYPALFGERRQPARDYVCLPKVVSENRPYFTADLLSHEIIASDLVFTVEDPTGFAFALASSSMFITWQKAVGGRLKSDLRFSSTLVWNNFPVPALDDATRQRISEAGKKILEARMQEPNLTLAEQYAPLTMRPELRKAHDALDRIVDKAFGAPRKLTTEGQRLEILFDNYQKLTQRGGQ